VGGPYNYPLGTWQELNWYPEYSESQFFDFCSNVTNINAPANITAIDHALAKYSNGEPWVNLGNYATYFQQAFLPLCTSGRIDSTDTGCFSTQNREFSHVLKSFANNRTETFYADPTNGAQEGSRSYLYTSNSPCQ